MNNKNVNKFSTIDKINLVKSNYNSIAKKYAKVFFEDDSDNKYIDKFLKSLSGPKILDAGCGVGGDCKYVQKKGFKAIGIDFAEEMIKEAQKEYPIGNFEVMDVTQLFFKKESFDGIIFKNILFHLPKEQIDSAFRELNRVLKKEGKVILTFQEGNEEKIINEPLKEENYIYMKNYTLEFIKDKLNENNLKIYDIEREQVDDKNCPIDQKTILYITKK